MDEKDLPEEKTQQQNQQRQQSKKKKKKEPRPFDFSKHSRRHVALQVVYLGWDYHGYTVQETTDKTVEAVLFPAFITTRLIESRETSDYHRCGRTDKGVSAFAQVISITFRSALCTGLGVIRSGEVTQSDSKCICGRGCSDDQEMPFTRMLNRSLPPDIRVLAWSPAPIGFSARFDCTSRLYHYTFPFPENNLNLDAMREGAAKFVGTHDFRNFCKADITRAGQSFYRDVFSANIATVPSPVPRGPNFATFEIVGSSFLWHQVRCLMTVLFSIGRNEESVEIIETLLDPEKTPYKPAYAMAADFPLVLSHCGYDRHDLQWREDAIELARVAEHFEKIWAVHAVQASLIGDLVSSLRARSGTTSSAWSGALKAFLPPGQPKLIQRSGVGKKRIHEEEIDEEEAVPNKTRNTAQEAE